MNNETPTASVKPLKIGFCGFCDFVRGRGGKASPRTRIGAAQDTPIHNNKNNRNIYINKIARSLVTAGGIV